VTATDTPTWFDQTARANFERLLLPTAGVEQRVLQIGAFRGDASAWLLENVLTHPDSRLRDVDTWEGSPGEAAHAPLDWDEVYGDYVTRVAPWADRVAWYEMTSDEFFRLNDERFDFIYVDGCHEGPQVLQDGMNAMRCVKPGGLVAFDDYQWGHGLPPHLRPKEAIDAIISTYGTTIQVFHLGAQVWIRNAPANVQIRPATVAVGYCTGHETMTAEFTHCYMRLAQRDARGRQRIIAEHSQVVGGTSIPDARCNIVRNFLAGPPADYLWFVDTDATFAPDILEHLLAVAHPTERPIVGGLAFRTQYGAADDVLVRPTEIEPMVYVEHEGSFHPIRKYPIDRAFQVDGLPTHCLLIHRSVLEDPRWLADGHHQPWFRMDVREKGGGLSEDLYFCREAKRMGYPIWAHARAKTGHVKWMVVDEQMYLDRHPDWVDEMRNPPA
jgi:predicted O-methyltransferase YrrM